MLHDQGEGYQQTKLLLGPKSHITYRQKLGEFWKIQEKLPMEKLPIFVKKRLRKTRSNMATPLKTMTLSK